MLKFNFNSKKAQQDLPKNELVPESKLRERGMPEPDPKEKQQTALLKILHFNKLKKNK